MFVHEMDEDFDINKTVAEFLTQHIDSLYNTGKAMFKGASDQVRLHLYNSYKAYLSEVAEKYSVAKSFFIRHEPTYLYNFYIPLSVSNGYGVVISRVSIRDLTAKNSFVVVTGGAGSGKSVLMRHLFLDTLRQKQRVPVFIELRDLNHSDQSLKGFIHDTLTSQQLGLDIDYIEKAMKAGHFAFFFDGFDELSIPVRRQIGKQIQKIAKSYDKNLVIVTSRPEDEFSGWQLFSIYKMDPLNLDQACDLVEKLPYDSDLKRKFTNDLRAELFNKHHSFLSNPLLLSIMLMTYGENADIPSKLNVFYSQAYEALFHRHDAYKGGFQRERSCNLDIQDFARVFSAFCLQTYDKRLFQFSSSQTLDFLEKAKKLVGIDFDEDAYLLDAKQAVCLLVEDGIFLNFPHRSFQEYFTARFICDSRHEIKQKLISKYAKNIRSDNVFGLLYEMAPELVECEYILPGIENLASVISVKKSFGITHFVRYMKIQWDFIFIANHDGKGENIAFGHSPSYNDEIQGLIQFTLKHSSHLTKWKAAGYTTAERNRLLTLVKAKGPPVPVKNLTSKDDLVCQLFNTNGFMSGREFEAIFEIRNELIKKHRSIDQSLDQILEL